MECMRSLSVLVITNRYPPDSEGGYESSCALVVQELRRRGHSITVVTRRSQPSLIDGHVSRILFDRNSGDRTLLLTGWALEALDCRRFHQILEQAQPDVAYIWGSTGLSVRVLADATRRVPTVVYVADYWLADWLSGSRMPDGFAHQIRALANEQLVGSAAVNRVVNRVFSRVDRQMHRRRIAVTPSAVEFDSQHMADDLRRRNVLLGNGKVIPHALDLNRFHYIDPRERPSEPPRILFVGRVVPQKGVETLIDAMQWIRERLPSAALTLAGTASPAYGRSLGARVASLGLVDSVDVVGHQDQQELQRLYDSHTVLAFPSEWEEPFGIVLLEAMASGLPVVSSAAGGSREIVSDGLDGLVFERGNSRDLADKLCRLLSSEDLRSDLARRGRAKVVERYDIPQMVDQIEGDLLAVSLQHEDM